MKRRLPLIFLLICIACISCEKPEEILCYECITTKGEYGHPEPDVISIDTICGTVSDIRIYEADNFWVFYKRPKDTVDVLYITVTTTICNQLNQ